MLQDNIKNKLRQLDDELQPDLSNMNEHWQQMQHLLQPVMVSVKRPAVSIISISVLMLIVAGCILLYLGTTTTTKKSQPAAVKMQEEATSTIAEAAALVKAPNLDEPTGVQELGNGEPTASEYFNEFDSAIANLKINFTPCETCGEKKGDSVFAKTDSAFLVENNRKILQQFLNDIQNPAQEFIINTNRDTSVVCMNGTVFFIPASIFSTANDIIVNGQITIQVKEFYSYQDIISNKLGTTSSGNQLVSGGMLHTAAVKDGKEIKLAAGKQLKVQMPTNNYDEEMQLFTNAATQNDFVKKKNLVDTGALSGKVNWLPAGQFQRLQRTKFFIKVFDPYGQPYKTFEKNDGSTVAKFMIRRDCKMTNSEVLKGLKGHFGMFYNSIKLKRSWSNHPKPMFSKEPYALVGDSIMIDFTMAKKLNVLSAVEIENYEKLLLQDSISYEAKRKRIPFYEFQLSQLGYMNCDRFRGDDRPKVDFTFSFNDARPSENFFSVLAFDNYRSVMEGEVFENKLRFRGLPSNEKAHLVSVGVKNGKVMSCIRPCNTGGIAVTDLEFTETSPAAFKTKLKELHLQ